MSLRSLILTSAIISSLGLCRCLPLRAAETAIQERLLRQVTVVWKAQELGVVLNRISETQDLAIWLDRRVDPQQIVYASHTDRPLQEVLEHLAEEHSLGVSLLGNILYLGPKESAHDLTTLSKLARDALAKSPAQAKRRWLHPTSTSWPRLSQPQDLLTAMMKRAGISVQNSNRITHDLWAAKKLPSLPLVDKAILILIGFDLTCQISPDGRHCQIVSIESPVLLKRSYRISKHRKQVLAQLPEIVPATQVQLKGRSLTVEARWEDHLRIKQLLAGKQARSNNWPSVSQTEREKSFSLQLKNQQVGAVVRQLANQLDLEIDWGDLSKEKKEALVSCNAKNVSVEELFRQILTPAGLQCQIDGKKILVEVAP